MRVRYLHNFLLTLTIVLSVSSLNAGYQVFVVHPAINNHAVMPGEPLPPTCRQGSSLKVIACRGEYEPASFVVRTDAPLTDVRVDVLPLQGPSGVLPAEIVDIRVVKILFRRITDWPALYPSLLLHDADLMVVDKKPRPEALAKDASPLAKSYTHTNRITRAPVDAASLLPVTIPECQQFWLTIHVPDDCPSETYRSVVTLTPKNAPATTLDLELKVPDFELLPPPFEYSVYHPVYLDRSQEPDNPQSFANVTPVQLLAELKNMVAHGCTNPNMYTQRLDTDEGNPDFERLMRLITIRDCAGIPRDQPLYLVQDPPPGIRSEPLEPDHRKRMVDFVRQVVDWAQSLGIPDVYFGGIDEASGAALRGERDSFEAIHEGGGKVFVACGNDFFELVGDLLNLPILIHPSHGRLDKIGHMDHGYLRGPEAVRNPQEMLKVGGSQTLMEPFVQEMVAGVHKNGFRIFSYMDPIGGRTLPKLHRRNRGLGLWKSGLDGTMTWAYTHIANGSLSSMPDRLDAMAQQSLFMGLVFRAQDSVIDTPGWEGYREGVDDARYLATLRDAIEQAQAASKHGAEVKASQEWLGRLEIDTDLQAMRQEIVHRVELLGSE